MEKGLRIDRKVVVASTAGKGLDISQCKISTIKASAP